MCGTHARWSTAVQQERRSLNFSLKPMASDSIALLEGTQFISNKVICHSVSKVGHAVNTCIEFEEVTAGTGGP